MEARATAKTLRIQPRKARLVLDLIRGKNVEEAAAICKFTPNKGGEMVGAVLKSAVANAVNNHEMDEEKTVCKRMLRKRRRNTQALHASLQKAAPARFINVPAISLLLWLRKTKEEHHGSESKPDWNADRYHP